MRPQLIARAAQRRTSAIRPPGCRIPGRYFSSAGHLVTGEVTADEPVTVFAVYEGKSRNKGVTVRQIHVWSGTFGGTNPDEALSVRQTSDGGYIVAGYTGILGVGAQDVYLIKTDQSGYAPPPE